ncbi:deoxyguanosinetriphosphate triphosphohydrolase [Deferribacter desulfuricans SSM1]|uniref:Deoxyguanosinetriphosphate triphosphohydrolase n=1 Tax=Deferribacter desulfuricans (strain DSM 14783 / JCM 11476 / NBRC 101012 / SSM1) TaxID=639282 RepID=D3PAP8_DEFDS|nr:deoxyguanosinetriphosphate triphosphohydrolase [Deferribacter desulfuricans]BAI79671.1 deoxyguanosinetriphosphate triphosphohydrolase [Deferribacter desulfuricans SSM1]
MIREELEDLEDKFLHPKAARSKDSKGRGKPEKKCELRTDFQRDRDRIIHSKAFRRLKHKTQVFLSPLGDHYRTRLTHTLEVMQIAKTIAKSLRLNEDLVEAIALGHDLGHTPFGHAGEKILSDILGKPFRHYAHSITVVEKLEKDGFGLNLTFEVLDGIVKHSKGKGPIFDESKLAKTLEGQIVRLADIIAYVNHDIDDAVRAKIISLDDIPKDILKNLGYTHGERIHNAVKDVVLSTIENNYEKVVMSDKMLKLIEDLREFLFANVYLCDIIKEEFDKAYKVLFDLYKFYENNYDAVPELFRKAAKDKKTAIVYFIAGMTDRYAIEEYKRIYLPSNWHI